jgi:hypothetical protein
MKAALANVDGATPQPISLTLTLSADAQAQLAEMLAAVAPALVDQPVTPVLLDRSGLARALGCSVASVDRLVRDGAPCVWLVESRRFELAVVLEWLRGRGQGQ